MRAIAYLGGAVSIMALFVVILCANAAIASWAIVGVLGAVAVMAAVVGSTSKS